MLSKNYFMSFCAFVLGLVVTSTTLAQSGVFGNPKPLSNPGGYATQEMRRIYRDSVGTGYSTDTLNQQTLSRATARVPNVGQSTIPVTRVASGLGTPVRTSKPYANYSPSPTVSPYLNLFREDLDGQGDFNYQTLVRPQLQQQAFNERLQREATEFNQRLQSIAAQSDFNPAGNVNQPPTGHQTVFMYYGRYYPQLNARRR
jgi:hypothetical protein